LKEPEGEAREQHQQEPDRTREPRGRRLVPKDSLPHPLGTETSRGTPEPEGSQNNRLSTRDTRQYPCYHGARQAQLFNDTPRGDAPEPGTRLGQLASYDQSGAARESLVRLRARSTSEDAYQTPGIRRHPAPRPYSASQTCKRVSWTATTNPKARRDLRSLAETRSRSGCSARGM